MSIKINTFKVDMTLIGDKPCEVCLETVEKKVQERVLDFFGHIDEATESKELRAHLICGGCNPGVIAKANSSEVFRKCISCAAIPGGDWRKKFTWDPEVKEFTVASAPLGPFPAVNTAVGEARGLNIDEQQRAQRRQAELRAQYFVIEPKHIVCGVVVVGLIVGGIAVGVIEGGKGGIDWGSNPHNGTNHGKWG